MEQAQSADRNPDLLLPIGPMSDHAQSDTLAREILSLTRNGLLVSLRFLDVALCALDWQPIVEGFWSTEGLHLYYNPHEVLSRYKHSRQLLSREYLHTVLHCILIHPFSGRAGRT